MHLLQIAGFHKLEKGEFINKLMNERIHWTGI